MAYEIPKPTPRYCLQHSRFTKQDGWVVWHLSLGFSGSIAVSGGNVHTDRTLIDVYSFRNSDFRDKPKLCYSKEFERYLDDEWTYRRRLVAFIESDDDDKLVTCIGDELDVIQLSTGEVIRSRKVNGSAYCLSVRRMEIFVSYYQSNKITVYNGTDLNEINLIILQGIQQSDYIPDMTAASNSIFVRTYNNDTEKHRALEFEEESGRSLSQLTNPCCTPAYVWSIAVSVPLGVVAIVSSDPATIGKGVDQIVFYSLMSKDKSSFLIVKVESDLYRIRISDRGDGMLTGIQVTGEVKIYYMNELYSYSNLKDNFASSFLKEDCEKLSKFFTLPKSQTETILKSDSPTENLLLALEGKGVLLPSNVHRIIDALNKLKINSFCSHIAEVYQKTRTNATSYDRFLSTLSAHLVASVPGDLCDYFNISDKKKNRITSSQNPGLSMLLALDEMKVINSSEVVALQQPLNDLKLVQAAAKISEYQAIGEEEKVQPQGVTDLTMEQKEDLFIQCLQKKIKSCYEAMSPVPWKNSCRWKAADLFVETTLILTHSKTQKSQASTVEQCEVHYHEIFSHDRIKRETRLILEGDPGSGKTMLMYQLAYDWSEGKFKDIKMLILLPLRIVEGMTLIQAIKDFYVPGDNRFSTNDIEMLLLTGKNPRCFLLDGLEEYNGVIKDGEQSEVMKVMSKLKFPACKAVISSRSHNTKSLPQYPVLKLGKFRNVERHAYIQKAFSDNTTKQTDAKVLTVDNQLISDLCSLPLLFVMIVHNIGSIGKLQIAKRDRITPFVRCVVNALCSVFATVRKTDEPSKPVRDEEEKHMSLEQLAYEGLCTGKQQLHWQKEFIESKLGHSKEWIDSGILVMEEIITDMKRVRKRLKSDLLGSEATKNNDLKVNGQENLSRSSVVVEATAELQAHTDTELKTLSERDNSKVQLDTIQTSSSATSYLPLRVKFFHTIIQEWFAANYLSDVVPRFRNNYFLQGHLKDNLLLINPFDLRYVLRFAVALSPTCCHIIIKHLLKSYRIENGNLPRHVMDYTFLCFAEYDGEHRHGILEAVAELCTEDIVINPEESRVVQQAKVDMLELASKCGIVLRKLLLEDVIVSATENFMQLNSGVMLRVLHTVELIEVRNRVDKLTTECCANILKFIDKCAWIKEARLTLPKQPPRVDEETAVHLQESGKTVIWNAGSQQSQTLDTEKNEWKSSNDDSLTSKAGSDVYFGWDKRAVLEVEETVSRRGGVITIPHTGVQLDIPAGALPDEMEACHICMKIIPSDFSDFSTDGYASNSSVIVELLPNNLTFQRPCKLTLPHCLQLKKGADYKATIFMSHHQEGTYPRWEEQSGTSYELTDTTCTIMLKRFYWVKCVIDDEIVETQRIQIYAAGRYMLHKQRAYEIEVGYFPDIPGGGEKLRSYKKVKVKSKRIFLVHKEGKESLKLFLKELLPNGWKIIQDEGRPKEIPFESIDLFKERSCSFKFVNYSEEPLTPIFIFKAAQGDKGVELRYRAEVRKAVSADTQTE